MKIFKCLMGLMLVQVLGTVPWASAQTGCGSSDLPGSVLSPAAERAVEESKLLANHGGNLRFAYLPLRKDETYSISVAGSFGKAVAVWNGKTLVASGVEISRVPLGPGSALVGENIEITAIFLDGYPRNEAATVEVVISDSRGHETRKYTLPVEAAQSGRTVARILLRPVGSPEER